MTRTRGRPPEDRVRRCYNLPTALVERLEAEAEARVLGPSILVELALGPFLDNLPPLPGEAKR